MSPHTVFDVKLKLNDLFACVFDDEAVNGMFDKYFAKNVVGRRAKYLGKIKKFLEETKMDLLRENGKIVDEIKRTADDMVQAVRDKERELLVQVQKASGEMAKKLDVEKASCDDGLRWLEEHGFYNYMFDGPEVFEEVFKQRFLNPLRSVNVTSLVFEPVNNLSGLDIGKVVVREDLMPKFVFGRPGRDPGEFCRPWGVCTDFNGRILVADRTNHRIQVFDEIGEFVQEIGKPGSGPGEMSCPSGVAVNADGKIIVADKDNHRIQIFTTNGAFLKTFGHQGSEPGEFNYPWDVACNRACHIAVSDSKNHRVQLFDQYGVLLKIFGCQGRSIQRVLDMPKGLSFRSDGMLLVADFGNHHIILLDESFKEVQRFGREGRTPGEFFRPQSVACMDDGTFAVSDCKNYRIQIFNACGRLLKTFGTKGIQKGKFDCPQGLAFSNNGDLVVVDFGNSRVQVF